MLKADIGKRHYPQKHKDKDHRRFSIENNASQKIGEQHLYSTEWKTVSVEFCTQEHTSQNQRQSKNIFMYKS